MEKYTLIITEKPAAASKIAAALDIAGKARKTVANGVPYYVATRKKSIIIVPAKGHLYTVANEKRGNNRFPWFSYRWVPLYMAKRGEKQSRVWLETIEKLARKADEFIDACDYDLEGSIIGYCILKYACGGKENISKRMKYSNLTREEIEKSYTTSLPHLDFGLIEAGLTRHEVDWLYGINLSRALTIAAKKFSGSYTPLSTGRVQGPTLKYLVEHEKTIKCFVPVPYWQIKAVVQIDGLVFQAEYEKKPVNTLEEANTVVNSCKDKIGEIQKVTTNKFKQTPPAPFDFGTLQREAYRLFRYTPIQTSKISQGLYLKALISYPRTSSQKLPSTIGYRTILKKLCKRREFKILSEELLANPSLKTKEGRAEDPAHPAIYPTGNLPRKALSKPEKNIWTLIVRRFMASFAEFAIHQSMTITIGLNGYNFFLRGRLTIVEGWIHFYKPYSNIAKASFPKVTDGQEIDVRKVVSESKFTQPPSRHNPSSILGKMEKEKVGTKATRAGIIQTLYDRKYIHNDRIAVADLGFSIIDVLEKYCPIVLSSELTRKLEEKMTEIRQGKETKTNVLSNVTDLLKPAIMNLKKKEETIGAQPAQALWKTRLEEKLVGTCPICGNGKLVILKSKKTSKRFVGCTNYFESKCNAAFPLPQKGRIKASTQVCKGCGWPEVRIWYRRGRIWKLCLNSSCKLKQRRTKE